jgi:AraC family transcriptional regulator of adaptative response / DNA-3-methyladenine glycosylase II
VSGRIGVEALERIVVAYVSAVKTTGIYCRPGCGARPRVENVTRFPSAAAAEAAGYRACFQCRPYRLPPPAPWTGPELVCRAVQLILDGALDGKTEAELGARLGVSARHLRRLFTAHLGVTPAGLARSARAHFARRLLDDTDLSVLRIALAAGFGSVRQFNRACRQIFRASPKELRARRRKSDRLVADGGLLLRLPFRGSLDWSAQLEFLGAHAIPGVECVSGQTYRRTVFVRGAPGVLELSPGGEDHLLLLAHLPHWEELIHVVQGARRIANLDLDLDEPTSHLERDPAIGPLVRARPGLRPPGAWDPFEAGVRALIGQHANRGEARLIAGQLVQRLGEPVAGLGPLGLTHLFPAPARLAEADLAGFGLPPSGARAIRAFARGVESDAIRLDRSVDLETLITSFTAIDGLVPWTAQYLALRLGEPDACPLPDVHDRRGVGRYLASRSIDLRERLERWRPWRAVATTHVWVADRLAARTAPAR